MNEENLIEECFDLLHTILFSSAPAFVLILCNLCFGINPVIFNNLPT